MSGEGSNIAALQSAQQHQDSAGEKSGFGLGHGDSIATITEGAKWTLTFFEGVIASYNHVCEGLIAGSSLVTLFGKSANLLGIKLFDIDKLKEHFSDEGGSQHSEEPDMSSEYHPDDYPHADNEIARNAEGLHDMHDEGEHHGQSFSPTPSPSFGDNDHGYERD